MTMTKRTALGVALAAGVGLTAAAVVSDEARAQDGWQPQQPVEFIIMAGTGGGADQIARLIQGIIEQNEDWSPVPFIPINKPGGSGAEALQYLKSNAGDPHIVMVTLNSFFTTPLLNPDLNIDVTEFTPIAQLARDTFVLWVNADSDIQTLDDWTAAVKEAGKDWTMGGTGKGQEDSIVTGMLEKKFGLDMTYVPFEGGGKVASALIGNQIDSTVNNPAEQLGFYEAGRSRPLMQLVPEPLPEFPDVPTAAELGYEDLIYYQLRAITAPPDIPEEAQQWYIDLFRKVNESQQWQDYCKSEGMYRDFVAGEEFGQLIEELRDVHEDLVDVLQG